MEQPTAEDYQALRNAVNAATKAGLTKHEVMAVVGDQLFAILHFGGGDVDKAMSEIAKTEQEVLELRQKVANHPNNKLA